MTRRSETLKFSLIVLYLLCDYQAVLARISSIDGAALAAFFVLYGMAVGGLLLCSMIGRWQIRVLLAFVLSAASVLQHSFEWTTSGSFDYAAFVNLYNATGQADAAIAQHGLVLAKAIAASLLLFLGIALPPRSAAVKSLIGLSAQAVLVIALTVLLYFRGGEGAGALPAAYPSISYASLLTAENIRADGGPRQTEVPARKTAPITEDIVLLVDESIVGNYLDINNRHGAYSGLLAARPKARVTNFGYAASIHKCSANSNLVLRYGGTPENYREAFARWPSIWRYAHAAGLQTIYIDGQSTDGKLQNMMTPDERNEIDEFIQFDGVPAVERDMRIADVVARRINNGRREFIYVNKVGAHFPVQDKYPEKMAQYRPELPRGSSSPAIWSSDRTGFSGTPDEWVRYRNSYRNTLLWNVGEFFDRLLTAADLRRATIVYTSDHGQDLHERGNPGNNTHCGADNAAQEEGLVPLVIIEGSAGAGLDWAQALAMNRNKSSAFRIFPTLLVLMGYDRPAVHARHGAALDEPAAPHLAYNVNFSPILGKKPQFRSIDLQTIVDPPTSDYAASRRP